MSKKSFILYVDFQSQLDLMTDDQAGKLMKCIFGYQSNGSFESDDPVVNFAMHGFVKQFERDHDKWEETRAKRSAAGKKSAEAKRNKKKQVAANSTRVNTTEQVAANSTVNVSESVTVTDSVNHSYTDEFLAFWSVYPKKKEKIRSQKYFVKAKKLASVADIMSGLERAVKSCEWTKSGGQYVPKPANWLDGGCWEDDYDDKPEDKANKSAGASAVCNQKSILL